MTRLVPRQKCTPRIFGQAGWNSGNRGGMDPCWTFSATDGSLWPNGFSEVPSLAGLSWSVNSFLAARELELISVLKDCRRETRRAARFTAASSHGLGTDDGLMKNPLSESVTLTPAAEAGQLVSRSPPCRQKMVETQQGYQLVA